MSDLSYIEIPEHIRAIIGYDRAGLFLFRSGVRSVQEAQDALDASARRIVFATKTYRRASDLSLIYPEAGRNSDWWLDEFETAAGNNPPATPLLNALREQEARVTA